MISKSEVESVVHNLFQPHDITHIKSIFRRILLDMANQKTSNLSEEEKDEQLRNDVAQMLENEKRQDETMIGGTSWRELKLKLKMQWFDVADFKAKLSNEELETLDKLEQA